MSSLRRVLLASGVGTLGLAALLGTWESVMRARGHGIVDLELAWTAAGFEEITVDWGAEGQRAARGQIWADFPFILAYATFATAAVETARRHTRSAALRKAGRYAVWLGATAAVTDVVEDIALLAGLDRIERGVDVGATAVIASTMASVKFAALSLAIAYGAAALAHRITARTSRTPTKEQLS